MPVKTLTAAYVLSAAGMTAGRVKASTELDKLGVDAAGMSNKVDGASTRAGGSLSKVSGGARSTGDEFDRQTSRVGGSLDKLGSSLGNWGIPFSGAISKIGGDLDRAKSHASGYSQVLSDVGKTAVTVGVAGFAAMGTESVKMAGNFQEGMTSLVTGAGESEANVKMVGAGILKMATDTGTATKQLTDGMFMISSAGFHGAEGLKVLQAAAEGAKVGNADLGTVSDGLTTIMKDYHLPVSQAAEVTSKLVATVANGKTHMADLTGALSTVMPVAATAKISLDQVLGAMATMTAQGTPAADAATYLKQTIAKLEHPTKAAADQMAALGLSATDLKQHLGDRGLTGTFEIMSKAITDRMGPSGLVLEQTLSKAKAATVSLDDVMRRLPAAQQAMVTGFMNGSVSSKDFHAQLAALSPAQQVVVNQAVAQAKAHDKVTASLNASNPTFETYTGAMATMTGGTKSMQAALELGGTNAKSFASNVATVSKTTTEAGGHVKGWAISQEDFNNKLAKAKEQAEVFAIKVGTALIPVVEQAANVVGDAAKWFDRHRVVAGALAAVLGGALAVAVGTFVVLTGVKMVESVGKAVEAVGKLGGKVLGLAGNLAESGSRNAMWASKYASGFADTAAAGGRWVGTQASNLATGAKDMAVSAARFVAASAVKIASYVATAAAATAAFVAENLATLGIIAGLALLVAGVIYVATHWKQVWGEIKDIASSVGKFLGGVWKAIEGEAKQVWGAIGGFFKQWWPEILGVMTGGVLLLPALLIKYWHQISGDISNVWNAITGFFSDTWHKITGLFSSGVDQVGQLGGRLISDIASIPGRIVGALGDVGSMLYNVGKAIIQGLIKGIEDMLSNVGSAVGDVVGIVKHIPIIGGLIGSPSPYFTEVGHAIGQGLTNGVAGSSAQAVDAVTSMARQVTAAGATATYVNPASGVSMVTAPYQPPMTPAVTGGAAGPAGSGVTAGVSQTNYITVQVPAGMIGSAQDIATALAPVMRTAMISLSQRVGASGQTL